MLEMASLDHAKCSESYFGSRRKGTRGRGAAGKVLVFGILEGEGHVWVQAVLNVRAETVCSA